MKRVPIRDNRSSEKIKPRVIDYIQCDDGTELIETKDSKMKKSMLLSDFLNQIADARQMFSR